MQMLTRCGIQQTETMAEVLTDVQPAGQAHQAIGTVELCLACWAVFVTPAAAAGHSADSVGLLVDGADAVVERIGDVDQSLCADRDGHGAVELRLAAVAVFETL